LVPEPPPVPAPVRESPRHQASEDINGHGVEPHSAAASATGPGERNATGTSAASGTRDASGAGVEPHVSAASVTGRGERNATDASEARLDTDRTSASATSLPLGHRLRKSGVRLLARIGPLLYRAWMRLVWATSRVDDSARRELIERRRRGERIVLLALHQDVVLAPWFLRDVGMCGLASTGDAGDLIDAAMRSLGHCNVRGGSSRGSTRRFAAGALVALIRYGREHADGFVIGITPDGSNGPAGACKPGCTLVAKKTGASIWCLKMHASPVLLLPTWDRTAIPLPFGRVWGRLHGPIDVATDADADALENARAEAESALHRLHAEAFAEAGRTPSPRLSRFC
jgi:lysophospholipid acyltransferase (LPLAT)-like uncharacterized protein